MMSWPEGIWYMKVAKSDIPEIIQTYLELEEGEKGAGLATNPTAE
jgi:(2Fe-2S) ferredoxin